MHAFFRLSLVALSASAIAACASSAPHELVDARQAYDRAAQGPAEQQAPAELKEAEQALQRAEKSFKDDGASRETKDLSYIAQRRSEIATAVAERRIAEQDKSDREKEFTEVSDKLREDTVHELKQTKQELGTEKDKVARERAGRIDAEQKKDVAEDEKARAEADAAAARAALAKWAQLVENERGLVITMSSGVMFASGRSDVLPEASVRLSAIATFLRMSPQRRIVVEGHTDSAGSDAFNMTLSQARADAVRVFFIGQGIPAERITAIGYGESRPIATNATNEGRTTNRRVEIVLQPVVVVP